MEAFAIGFIFGRLLASFFIAWVIMLVFSGFNPKLAAKRAVKWYGLLLSFTIFFLGAAASYVGSSG